MSTLRSLLIVFCLLFLASCAGPAFESKPRAALATRPGIVHREGRFAGSGGIGLFEQSWKPEGKSKAVVVLVHGLKDYSDRYAETAGKLVKAGYSVYAFDLRGHGESEGDRVWVKDFDDYLADLGLFLQEVRGREPGKRVFIFGHSMGGAIVTLFTLTRKPDIQGVVLSGPALKPGSDVSGFLIGVTKVLGTIAPKLAVMKLDDASFSRVPGTAEKMKADPLIYDGAGPAHTAKELLAAIATIQERMGSFDKPFLAMHGTLDKLTNPEGSQELYARAVAKDKALKLYPGYFHDLLHEPDAERVYADMQAWLDERSR